MSASNRIFLNPLEKNKLNSQNPSFPRPMLAFVGQRIRRLTNAVLSFMQEQRAAGVVEALRRRLQVSARVRRDSNWQVVPARELVPGDIVQVRPGDIIPADVKLLTGTLSVDQSALTGESRDVDNRPIPLENSSLYDRLFP